MRVPFASLNDLLAIVKFPRSEKSLEGFLDDGQMRFWEDELFLGKFERLGDEGTVLMDEIVALLWAVPVDKVVGDLELSHDFFEQYQDLETLSLIDVE